MPADRRRLLAACLALAAASCSTPSSIDSGLSTSSRLPPAVFAGAGDIGECGSIGSELTATLLDGISGTIFTAGDNAYPDGSADDYKNCYDPTWGRFRSRTRPTPGNHEYQSSGAVPYYAYYGDSAGPAGRGYYSFNLGAWHLVSLNSNVAADPASLQASWLRADLAASNTTCTLAYWHHPVFSTGAHGNDPTMREIFRILYDAHADVVINGHDHDYERFSPLNADGVPEPLRGVREFVVGTGGNSELRAFTSFNPNSEVRDSVTWGVLKLTLRPSSYEWEFVPVAGKTFRDSGSATCVR